jgi:hypothetical protein
MMLEAGADVNTRDERDGRTALMCAARHGMGAVVEALMLQGADLYARDQDGRSAVEHAEGRPHVKQMLEQVGEGRGGEGKGCGAPAPMTLGWLVVHGSACVRAWVLWQVWGRVYPLLKARRLQQAGQAMVLYGEEAEVHMGAGLGFLRHRAGGGAGLPKVRM